MANTTNRNRTQSIAPRGSKSRAAHDGTQWRLPGFQTEWLDLPDDQLCLRVLGQYVYFLLERRGLPIEPGNVTSAIAYVCAVEADGVAHAVLEKALRRMARGDCVGGAKLFREHMHARAFSLFNEKYAQIGIAHKRDRTLGGKKRAAQRQKSAREQAAKMNAEADKVRTFRKRRKWGVATEVARTFGAKVDTVRRALRNKT